MSAGAALLVDCPEASGRPSRLGPFPSSRDALKFGAWAAVGAAGATVAGPLLAVVFAVIGFGLAVSRIDGRPLDSRLESYLRWQYRRRRRRTAREPPLRFGPGGTTTVVDGESLAAVQVDGIPIAFLPADSARALFDSFRGLLRGLTGESAMLVRLHPLGHAPCRLGLTTPVRAAERRAADGYAEMAELLLRRRQRRAVLWVFRRPGTDADAAALAERDAAFVHERLGAMGIGCRSLRAPELGRLLHAHGLVGDRR